jgi:Polysaccharide lyase
MRCFVAGLLISLSLAGGCRAGDLHDSFDSGSADPALWSFSKFVGDYPTKQAQPLFPGIGGTAGAVSIVTTDADGGNDCPLEEMPVGGCQRAELQVTKKQALPYGSDSWYAFSFRIRGQVSASGSHRTVIGQWKGPGNDSPFVAQRFDDGIFTISVEAADGRCFVATDRKNVAEMHAAQKFLGSLDASDDRVREKIVALIKGQVGQQRQAEVLTGLMPDNALLPPPLPGTGQADLRTGPADLRSGVNRVADYLQGFAFLSDLDKYLDCPSKLVHVEPVLDRSLPSPRDAWVDMVYHIVGSHYDASGRPVGALLEVWADGLKIVRVSGDFGTRPPIDPNADPGMQNVKLGLYRVRQPGMLSVDLDEFSQASDVAGLRLEHMHPLEKP